MLRNRNADLPLKARTQFGVRYPIGGQALLYLMSGRAYGRPVFGGYVVRARAMFVASSSSPRRGIGTTGTTSSALVAVGISVGLLMLAACQTPAEHQAAKNAEINKQAAAEINRICALPDAQREAELKKVKEQSGVVLYCGNK